jgi:hypothetical protein
LTTQKKIDRSRRQKNKQYELQPITIMYDGSEKSKDISSEWGEEYVVNSVHWVCNP